MNTKQFMEMLRKEQIHLNAEQMDQFDRYYELLFAWNQKMNLTTITEKEDVYLKHFYDSLTPAFYFSFDAEQTMIDIGAGAGFPGIPLKICFPHLQLTLVDSLKKRTVFLQHLIEQLGLANVYVYHDRAESFAHQADHRQRYDLAVARAVAPLNILSELCLPFVKLTGRFLALKGKKGAQELNEAQKSIKIMGGTVEQAVSFQLPEAGGERQIMIIHKNRPTPSQYPRKPGLPQKKPLI